jgi:hypothetical protein
MLERDHPQERAAGTRNNPGPDAANLYPHLPVAEREVAYENLLRYFETALAISAERHGGLTPSDRNSTMKERSNVYWK